MGAAGGFACPPAAPPPPPPPPPPPGVPGVGACGGGVCGRGGGGGMSIGGILGSVTFPLAICIASLECVCVAIAGSMGDCRMSCTMGSSSSECDSSLCPSDSVSGDAGR